MDSHITRKFRQLFADIPQEVKRNAKQAYKLWNQDPFLNGLQFKELEGHAGIWTVRIGLHWRAIATRDEDDVTWFWIGSHADYDRLISRL